MRPGPIRIAGVVVLLLAWIVHWAFDHFLWDWLVQALEERWSVKEAMLTASISSYVLPLGGAVACVMALYWLLRLELARTGRLSLQTLKANGYLTAYEALHYLADESAWGKSTRKYAETRRYAVTDKSVTTKKDALFEAPGEFKRIAEQGVIKAVGILNGQSVQIPETYWTLATLDLDNCTRAATRHSVSIYEKVRVSREDIERAWPRPLWRFGRRRRGR